MTDALYLAYVQGEMKNIRDKCFNLKTYFLHSRSTEPVSKHFNCLKKKKNTATQNCIVDRC